MYVRLVVGRGVHYGSIQDNPTLDTGVKNVPYLGNKT